MTTTKLVQVTHDLKSNTLEVVRADEAGIRVFCRNFSPVQVEEFKAVTGEYAARYITLAGWTPEYIAEVAAEEQRLADEVKAKADAEAADAKAKQDKADKEAFDAEVARQVAIMEAAKKIMEEQA